MKSKLIKGLITCLIIGTVITGGYYGYNKYSTSKSATSANQYMTVTAKKTNMQVGIQGTGSVYAAVSKDVVANNAGVLKNLNVKVGDTVKAGQQLFIADSDDLRRNVTTAQNNLQMQKLTLVNDQNNYNDQLAKANTAVTDAQNKLNDAIQQVNKMTVTAPVGGKIVAVNYKNGDDIQSGGSSGNGQANNSGHNGQMSGTSHSGRSNDTTNNGGSVKTVVLSIEDPNSPGKKVDVVPNNSGILKNLNVKVGDTVKAGQVLFVVDSDALRQGVTTAQGNLDKSNSALADIKNSNKIAIDNLAISDAQTQLNNAVQQVNSMTVTAPISGLITTINNNNGDNVGTSSSGSASGQVGSSGSNSQGNSNSGSSYTGGSSSQGNNSKGNGQGGSNSNSSNSASGQSSSSGTSSQTSTNSGSTQSGVLTIVDPSTMKVKVAVDELDIAKVKEGQKAEIKFDSIADKVFDGAVESIAQTGTSSNNVTTYDVVVSIANPGDIKIGMNANVNILVDSKDDALTIPSQALVEKDGKEYVQVTNSNGNTTSSTSGSLDNGKLVQIKTGLENENYVEVVDGITEGQKILVALPKSTSATNTNTNTNSRNSLGGSGFGGGGFGGFSGGSGGSRQQSGSNGGNRN